jgi:predicted ATPase/DNA-binding SARP family transcriptional activator
MADHSDFEPRSSVVSPARLTLLLLGPPQVMVNGEVVMDQRSPKPLALLAYLAIEAHRPHPRGTLAALFWPDQPGKRAFQNLRQTLSRLRKAIRDRTRSGDRTPSGDRDAHPPHLLTDSETIQFNRQSDYSLDVEAFETLLISAERHRHRRLAACPTCASQLAQATEYYRGDFLAGLHPPGGAAFAEWLLLERERLGQRACAALHALASSHLARGEPEAARGYAQRLLTLDPWNEAAMRLLLRALTLSEGRNAALQHYRAFRQALADELGVEPEDETLALVEQIGAGTLADLHPRTPTSHFPMPATPFIGREAERKQINDSLAGPHQRLLTLCGPGGIGKTRLALEVAAEQAPLWQDGVWFVPLAEVPATEGLVDALADALDLRATDGPLEAAQLMDFLRPRELLLILDGFEHLMAPPQSPPRSGGRKGGVGLLQDMLRWAPQLRILITSRARLGLQGEWAISLEGLDLPPDVPATVAEAQTYSAVQLFVQSARRVAPDFTLSPENLSHVVRICHLVAGLPLGIELAAAWVRLFPCRQIADEIEHSPDFLHNSGGNTPARQHSLRATFEYSYNLLSETEGALFRKLSVFRGGFTADAARQVTGSGPPHLVSLLDKSLLQTSPSRRLDVHLTLRNYAAEKLAEMPEEERETQERHGRVYLSFVQEREAALWGENPKQALEEINVELGNVREAWRWAVSQGSLEEIDTSTEGLSRFYDLRGRFREGETAFGSAANRMLVRAQNDTKAQRVACRLLAAQALCLQQQALYPQVIQVVQTAIELARMTQEVLCEARATFLWGEALWRQGDYEPARTQLERALSLARAGYDAEPGTALTAQQAEANCLNSLAGVCWSQGDYPGARTYLKQALRVASTAGNRRREGAILGNLGVVAVEQGDYAEARTRYQQALHTQQEVGDRDGEGTTLVNLGNLCLYLGVYAEARTYYQQALTIHQETGARANESQTMGNLGLLFHYLGEDETALEHSQQALWIAQAAGERSMQGARWLELGHALLGQGRLEEAAQAYQNAVALRRELDQPNLATEPLAGLARVALAQGDLARAQAHVEEILGYLETGTLHGTINPFQIYLTCYRVLKANDDLRAQNLLVTAYDLLRERAAKITDEGMRRSFLENVAAHREIVSHYSERE